MIRGALFDMDGVLVDNTPVHVEAFARFCERYGVTDWRGKLAASYGMGNDDILRRLLPPELIRERGIESLAAEKERFIVSGDRVRHCKPDPEIYLAAAAGLGLAPAECVVFEDAPAGIESARRAGAGRIVALTTTLPAERLAATGADRIVADFTRIENLDEILS